MAAPAVPIRIPRPLPTLAVSGAIVIPAPTAKKVEIRYRTVEKRDSIEVENPAKSWEQPVQLTPHPDFAGHYQVDVNRLGLADGTYECEFIIDGDTKNPVPDPYAEEITKFGGYRTLFRMENGCRVTQPFSWADEIPQGVRLANNNAIVIYEMPVHWMDVADQGRQVGLGTFEKIVFEHLRELADLGVNAIELLPAQDSPDTLNWGYGTRFFFAPDWDMGTPLDMMFFIKSCHRFGIRVILDVVMNHSKECPLEKLAREWYYLKDDEEPERAAWGGVRFRYAQPVDGKFYAREFHYTMAEFWVCEFHIDGFRLDEFKGINNYDFVQGFRERAWAEHDRHFPDRPFIVIAEDSARRADITDDHRYNDRPVVDAIWNFAFRDELRRLLSANLETQPGEPGRYDRIKNMISGQQTWDGWARQYRPGFSDMAKAVNYVTSHDVEGQTEQRLMNFFLGDLLRKRTLLTNPNQTETQAVRAVVDHITAQSPDIQAAHSDALERVRSALALMITSAGIPMFLAGEEFADVHDLEHTHWQLKMSDPVDYERRQYIGHRDLFDRVRDLITLRTQHPALQRNEVEFFYSHPAIDQNHGVRVFAFCRNNGKPLGSANQVVVLANCGEDNFYAFDFPWYWSDITRLKEHGEPMPAMRPQLNRRGNSLVLSASLAPFQVRVFSTY